MRVLLMGPETDDDSVAAEVLRREGHEVVRCHPADAAVFPCLALVEGRCPLDDETVDAAVIVGRGTRDQLDVGEEPGARCALRRHIPLIAVGYHYASPLVPWAAETIIRSEDLGTALHRAVTTKATPVNDPATSGSVQ